MAAGQGIKQILLFDECHTSCERHEIPHFVRDNGRHFELHKVDTLQKIDEALLANAACLLVTVSTCSASTYKLLEEFLRNHINIPVILIAGKINTKQLQRCYDLGLEGYIDLKLLPKTDLINLIELAIPRHAAFAQLLVSHQKYHHYFEQLRKGKMSNQNENVPLISNLKMSLFV